LTLSYAAIALLAASALGAVLLTTLRDYYQQRERDYLLTNAAGVTLKFAEALREGLPLGEQAQGLAFLLQARVRVLGVDRQVLADSGLPDNLGVAVGAGKFTQAPAGADNLKAADRFTIIAIRTRPGLVTDTLPFPPDAPLGATGVSVPAPPNLPDGLTGEFFLSSKDVLTGTTAYYSSIKVAGTPLGFEVNNGTLELSGGRSDGIVDQPLVDSTGILRGYVELSAGPAYGQEIVNSVAEGWAIASMIAILLAATAGWLFSRRLSQPIVALTEVTARMAEGDLSTRANTKRDDELGTLARSFNEMADQVEGTITTLRQFIADAAHELNTPLTALHTELELAESHAAMPLADLRRARNQVTRLEELTQGLLDLSRLEVRSFAEATTMDMRQLVRELSEVYASQAEQSGLAFNLDLPAEPLPVRGQPDQLRRAIGNLLDNAIKFTPEGGAVRLGAYPIDRVVEITVEDTGIGIPPEDLAQLFGRFHRGRNASAYPGHGLGLAIVKAIAEAHDGTVHAENVEPGARFSLRLPLA
jgi:signal transduction histidine kinase